MGIALSSLVAKLRLRLSSTTDDALLTEASLIDDINNGLKAFADERDWPWLNTTGTIAVTAGTGTYSLPAGYTHVHSLSIDNESMSEVNYDGYLSRLRTQATGRPRLYTQVGDTILLAPSPTEAHTIEVFYQQEENDLVSDGDTTAAPARYASIITTYAAIYSAIRIGDTDGLSEMYQLRKDELQRVYDAMQLSDLGPRIEVRGDMNA